ncbi:hypothetical protein BDW74DRAFT_186872 [Aspergillus multicolor]|uniref:uncharacterized protein n=1 Tax=Aspergillus multicolor TaxID=41759 RepID=UPI003CCD1ED8
MSSAESSFAHEGLVEYSGDRLRNVAIAFTVLEIFAVGLRFISTRIGHKVLDLVSINYGRIGYHRDFLVSVGPGAFAINRICSVILTVVYPAACAIPRIMLLTMYLRIFHAPWLKTYRIISYVLIVFVVAYAFAIIMTALLQCIPLACTWDRSIQGAKCINLTLFYRWGTLPNILIDIVMLFLPQPVVWTLQMSSQARLGLGATILTGSIGTVTSICRCVAFFQNNPYVDTTWTAVTYYTWSLVEPGVYLIAACLPCYRPILRHARDCFRRIPASSRQILQKD